MTAPLGLFVGLATLDLIQRVSRLPGPDEKIVAERMDLAAGGPATGAAVTFAALGGRATLLTALGSSALSQLVREDLEQHRVEAVDAAPEGGDLAVSAVAIIDATGERSVISRNAEDARVVVPEDLAGRIARAQVLLIDGHHPTLAVAAATLARERDLPVVLDAGSWKPALDELLPLTTMAICSSVFRLPDGGVPSGALLDHGPEFVAVTDGPRPIRWWAGRDSGTVAVPQVRVRDTLGAGDTFHGAFAHALALGQPPTVAIRRAAEVAALRVTHTGPRSWLTDPELSSTSPFPGARRS